MEKEIEIPEGYEARIEGNKVVLEPKESEDERIRKALIAFFKDYNSGIAINGISAKEFIAYLEKQKEQKFTHHETDESLQSAVTHQMEDDGDVDNFVRRGIDDIILKYAKLGARWQKEQKPAEWSDSVAKEMFIKALERAVEQTKKGYELTDCDRHSWWEDFKAYSGIKPAEWSEEDDKLLNYAISMTDDAQVKRFLESLRFQPKQECSEKDEKIRKWLISYLENKLDDDEFTAGGAQMMHNAIAWLEKTEWGEEDETALDDLMWCIEQAKKSTKDENDMGNIWFAENWVKNRLKSLRPQSHWKPSKVQMKYLDIAIAEADGHKSYNLAYGLEKLKDNLKKL